MYNVIRCQFEPNRAEAIVANCTGGLLGGIGFRYAAEALLKFEESSQVVPVKRLNIQFVL
jgi:hypothetical protein